MFRRNALALPLLVLAACGGTIAPVGDGTPDGAPASGGASSSSTSSSSSGGASSGAAGSSGAGASSGLSGSSGVSSGGLKCPTPPPAPTPGISPGTVTFVLTNGAADDRYVMTKGRECEDMAISGVVRNIPFSCGCECAQPGYGYTLARVKPGATLALTWSEMSLVTYTSSYDLCSWSGVCVPKTGAVPQPVAAGTYTASFNVATAPPPAADHSCIVDPDGAIVCNYLSLSRPPGSCPLSAPGSSVKATFTVPVSGDTTVNVTLS